jgi:FkbM family methyltransferase
MKYTTPNKVWDFPYDSKMLECILKETYLRKDYQAGLNYIRKIKNPIVLDIGAYIGVTPLFFARHKGAKIYAVEPHPDSYKSLLINTQGKNITCINNAIVDCEGEQFIYQNDKGIGMSLIKPKNLEGYVKLPIVAIRIEHLFRELKLTHVDLMKIDVEGCEYEIFLSDGFKELVPKIDFIIGESHEIGTTPYTIIKPILEEAGYKVKFLPVKNVEIHSRVMVSSGKEHLIKQLCQTMFIAQR